MEIVKQDGRFKRSARSRQTIIDAMLALIEQGQYIPTAQQVADEANISIRTVFRHFTEMEQLYRELDDAIRPSYEKHFINKELTGSIDERIERLVDSRMAGYLEIFHLFKSTHALLWRSEVLNDKYYKNLAALRALTLKILPELKDRGPEVTEIGDALTSFQNFDRYYTYQKLPIEECARLIKRQIRQLLID